MNELSGVFSNFLRIGDVSTVTVWYVVCIDLFLVYFDLPLVVH